MPGAFKVLVAVGNLDNAPRLMDAALDIVGDERPAEVVVTRLIELPHGGEIRSGLYEEEADQPRIATALGDLSERARQRGVHTVALSQLSSDFAGDLVKQAANIEADVLLLGWNEPATPNADVAAFVRKVLREAPCDVAVLVDPLGEGLRVGSDAPLVVSAEDRFHSAAALELAVRVARSRNASVRLVDASPARDGDKVEASRRLSALAERIQRMGAWAEPHLAGDGVTPEIVRQASRSGAVAVGIDEQWFGEGGTFGRTTDELIGAVGCPILLARAKEGVTRSGLSGLLERLQGRGVGDAATVHARLTAAGPAPTHVTPDDGASH